MRDDCPRARPARLPVACRAGPRRARRAAVRRPASCWTPPTPRHARSPTTTSRRPCAATRGSVSGRAAHHDAASAREQAGVDPADGDTARELAAGNAAYEERFGHVFLIRAAGRDAEEILAELDRRLGNDDEAERAETVDNLRQIAMLRLERRCLMVTLSARTSSTPPPDDRPRACPSLLESRSGDAARRGRHRRRRARRLDSAASWRRGLRAAVRHRRVLARGRRLLPRGRRGVHGRRRRALPRAVAASPYGYSTYRGS